MIVRPCSRRLNSKRHRCWASVAGVRVGLAALRELGVKRSGGRQLHGYVEIGEPFQFERDWRPEIMGFVPCTACGELTAKAYLRVVGEKHVCIPCSGYDR